MDRYLSNLKQLQLCWQLYTDENNDVMPPNKWRQTSSGASSDPGSWLAGNTRTDTNTINIEEGVLYRYNRSVKIYYCPSDRSTVEINKRLPRTRSYSLNCWLSGTELPEFRDSRFIKASQLANPGPTKVFVFLDEHENTIEDGVFGLSRAPERYWANMPADRHSSGCNFSFADGRAAKTKWRWPKQIRDSEYNKPVANDRDVQDLRDLQEAIPR